MKALLIRLDRLGDLVLSLPVDENEALKNYECHWLIAKGLGFVPQNAVPKRQFQEIDRKASWQNFTKLCSHIRNLKPDIAVSIHAPWWVSLALFICRVPTRIGLKSQWHSFLFFNKGIRQKRSRVEHHELDYNHRLVFEGLSLTPPQTGPHLKLKASSDESWFNDLSIPQSFAVVHPGMGGSALNWPTKRYASLIEQLSQTQPIAITGTTLDKPYIEPLKAILSKNKNIIWLDEKLNNGQLLTLLNKARFIVAPSTGVIHLAASLGRPCVGLYSEVKVESPKRWAPRGEKATYLTPPSNGAISLENLSVSQVLTKIQQVSDNI